jgi:hypothetical protein
MRTDELTRRVRARGVREGGEAALWLVVPYGHLERRWELGFVSLFTPNLEELG